MIHQFLVSVNTKDHTSITEEALREVIKLYVEDAIKTHHPPDVTINVRCSNLVEAPKPKPVEEPYYVTADWMHFNLVNIDGETESAFHVQFIDCKWKDCWLPKSHIADASSLKLGYRPLSITRWLAEARGFIP